MPSPALRISITTGDIDGIGLEVAVKALRKWGPQKDARFLLWRGTKSYPKSLRALEQKFKIVSFSEPHEALTYLQSPAMKSTHLVEVVSSSSPALWVEQTANWCAAGEINGMSTGPISKTEIYKAGLHDMGHTDILKRISGVQQVHMGFIGSEFNVVLTTAHIPLQAVSAALNTESILAGLKAANDLRLRLPTSLVKKPIALLGVNPHAGEMGLIGSEESRYFGDVLQEARRLKIPVFGPLSPDTAFEKSVRNRTSVFLAMYHDQGLIPFKMAHGQDSGVHVSLGLPFIRTSVDHGTAKDIFAKNKANAGSMLDALQACVQLAKASQHQKR